MSFTYFSQYDEAVSSENLDVTVDQKQQALNSRLQKPSQKENFWCLLRKKIFSVDECFSFLRGTLPFSSRSRNCFQQLFKVLTCSSLVQSCPNTSRAIAGSSPALCACCPVGSVPPPTKIMVCLPCPSPALPSNMAEPAVFSSAYGSNNRCESYPFCVPRKLDVCDSQTSKRGKYLPPPARRQCSAKCLHVCDLKAVRPCMADQGRPCIAHCFESHPKCPSY